MIYLGFMFPHQVAKITISNAVQSLYPVTVTLFHTLPESSHLILTITHRLNNAAESQRG